MLKSRCSWNLKINFSELHDCSNIFTSGVSQSLWTTKLNHFYHTNQLSTKHEGLNTHKHNNIGNVSVATFPVSQSELVSQILTDPELNFSDLKILPSRKLEFQKEFERRWRANKKFAVQKQFKDVSKTYVFVLLSHAGIGMSSLNQVKNPAVWTVTKI